MPTGPPGLSGRRTVEAFLGEDLLAWLLLALGSAMAVGNLAALVRPPRARRGAAGPDRSSEDRSTGTLERPPLWRSTAYILLGTAVSVWALLTLTS